jgi:multiple sugar transport system permease protein
MRRVWNEAGLFLIAIPILFWTVFPIYHLFVLSISTQQTMLDGRLWPEDPTFRNYYLVVTQGHYYLTHFWLQMFNSFLVAVTTGVLTLVIATFAAFAISRLKAQGGRLVMNFALATYLIPAAFLAVPMYKVMGMYGLLNTKTALILAMVALASPYAIWVLKQASDKLPQELDEAAIIDGATVPQLFRMVYLPLMKPSLVAIGIYALLLAWNEYLYAFLLLSHDRQLTLAVALGTFLGADDSPWNLLMATGFIYALPPVIIYYTFRNYMVSGLTQGAVKS